MRRFWKRSAISDFFSLVADFFFHRSLRKRPKEPHSPPSSSPTPDISHMGTAHVGESHLDAMKKWADFVLGRNLFACMHPAGADFFWTCVSLFLVTAAPWSRRDFFWWPMIDLATSKLDVARLLDQYVSWG